MDEVPRDTDGNWTDPDDAPEWTAEMFDVGEYAVGREVIRPATGYLGPNGAVRGRPPLRDWPKQQVTLRLDPEVIDHFRAGEPGWQGRINEALRKVVGLARGDSTDKPAGPKWFCEL